MRKTGVICTRGPETTTYSVLAGTNHARGRDVLGDAGAVGDARPQLSGQRSQPALRSTRPQRERMNCLADVLVANVVPRRLSGRR